MAAPIKPFTRRTDEVLDKIVDGLSVGRPLREMCREDDMPSASAVYDWIAADDELATRIARARERGFDAIAEHTLELADNVPHQSEAIQKAKLQIETRLKLLAKWSPKKYGDKQEHTLKGDAAAPLQVQHKVLQPDTVAYLTQAMLERPKD